MTAICRHFQQVLVALFLLVSPWAAAYAQVEPPNCETGTVGSLALDDDSIVAGDTTTLRWFFDGPNDCPLWINGESVPTGQSGSRLIQPLHTITYIFTTSTISGGQRELGRITATVTSSCFSAVTGEIGSTLRTIHIGGSAPLYWRTKQPQDCDFSFAINEAAVANSGTMTVQPASDTMYQLIATSPSHQSLVLSSALLKVNSNVVYIRENDDAAKQLLVKSLGEDGTLVILGRHLNMDLTGYEEIYIRESVILTSDDGVPPRPVRTATEEGPMLFTRFRPKPQFIVKCNADQSILGDNVKISGFRLYGPHMGIKDGNSNLEVGIQVNSCTDVEISNMEVAGWSGSAIAVTEEADNARMVGPNAVFIHDNFLHHNQHVGGNGYGVAVSAGAYARIERNVFDFDRHAIEASGDAGTGYYAKNNLILKGGGVHGKIYNSHTHLLDVHGDDNCPWFLSSAWNCGKAGDEFWFIGNAVQYTRDIDLKIRGKPRRAVHIDSNIFARDVLMDTLTKDGAIDLYTHDNVFLGSGLKKNIAGYDSYGRYGVCDFDGDHKDDLFLATGRTWWMMSAARHHWTFLKEANERLEDVGLGDFNGDGRCDVLAANTFNSKWEVSSGGNGPWTALPGTYAMPFNQLAFADFNGDGRTDVFRRDPAGQWWVVSPGVFGWQAKQSSSLPLANLRFGDFNGDGRTDVLSRAGGHWSVSFSATSGWTKINNLNDDINKLYVADLNNDGTDDLVRYKPATISKGDWQVSWGGRTGWRTLKTITYPAPPAPPLTPDANPVAFAGNFDTTPGDDMLFIDFDRAGHLFDAVTGSYKVHSLFHY